MKFMRMGGFLWGMATGGLFGMPIKLYKTGDVFYLYMTYGYMAMVVWLLYCEYRLAKKVKEKENGTVAKR